MNNGKEMQRKRPRRTNSLPGNPLRGSHHCILPDALAGVLDGRRREYKRYNEGMTERVIGPVVLPLASSTNSSSCSHQYAHSCDRQGGVLGKDESPIDTSAATSVSVAGPSGESTCRTPEHIPQAPPSLAVGEEPLCCKVEAAEEEQGGDTSLVRGTNASHSSESGLISRGGEEECENSSKANSTAGKVEEPATTGAAMTIALPYDAESISAWMKEYRSNTDHCPPGIAVFAMARAQEAQQQSQQHQKQRLSLSQKEGLTASLQNKNSQGGGDKHASHKQPQQQQSAGGSPQLQFQRGGVIGSAHQPLEHRRSGDNVMDDKRRPNEVLEALGEMWGDRKDMPIAVSTSANRRGLFGHAERKTLPQMVVSVLNKVTTDPNKFREVKNELLRLPIPEASVEQLDEIVGVFFTKAVREPHFCGSYADLVAALCILPAGQHISGDKSLSLEHRLRTALVKRCQNEFTKANLQPCTTFPGAGAEATADEKAKHDDGDDSKATEEKEGTAAGAEDYDVMKAAEIAAIEKERRDRMRGNVCFIGELLHRGIVSDEVMKTIFLWCCTGSEGGTFTSPPQYTPAESQIDEIIAAVDTTGEQFFAHSPQGRAVLLPLIECLRHWTEHYPVRRCCFLLMSTVEKLEGYLPEGFSGAIGGAAGGDASHTWRRDSRQSPSLPMQASHAQSQQQQTETPATRSVRPECVAKIMASLSSGQATPETVAQDVMTSFGSAFPAVTMWLDRCLSVVKEEKTRLQTGAMLGALAAALHPQNNQYAEFETDKKAEEGVEEEEAHELFISAIAELRAATMGALRRALEQKLYEDIKLFRFWAQLVLGDNERVVLDEGMLNEGLRLVMEIAPSAVRPYLADVGRHYTQVVMSPSWRPSEEATGFLRYRPLLEIHFFSEQEASSRTKSTGAVVAPTSASSAAASSAQFVAAASADVRAQCIEADVFYSLRAGGAAWEGFFERLRTHPRLITSDPTLGAEVLSAVLIAELSTPGRAFLEDSVDVLVLAVDGGAVRRSREVEMVAEVLEVLRNTPLQLTIAAGSRVLNKLIASQVVSDETRERAWRYYMKSSAALSEEGALQIEDEFAAIANSSAVTSGDFVTLPAQQQQQQQPQSSHHPYNLQRQPHQQQQYYQQRHTSGYRHQQHQQQQQSRGQFHYQQQQQYTSQQYGSSQPRQFTQYPPPPQSQYTQQQQQQQQQQYNRRRGGGGRGGNSNNSNSGILGPSSPSYDSRGGSGGSSATSWR